MRFRRDCPAIAPGPTDLRHALWTVFKLGATHIAEGTDHLLFLLSLLLPAGLSIRSRWRWGERQSSRATMVDALKVITAFTLGHSVTLLIATLGVLSLPSRLVEALIAASIVVTAAHAIVPVLGRDAAAVALAFGLVHGLGFASALDGLAIDSRSLWVTLVGFNLGIEAMQAAVLALTLPGLLFLHGSRLGSTVRISGALIVGSVALVWFAQRALDFQLV